MRAISRLSALPALTLLLAACGGEKTNDVQPVINSFTLSKNTVSAGEVIQVAWDVTGADKITILQGTAALITDDGRASGSVDSSPIDTALAFTLTAVNSESGTTTTDRLGSPHPNATESRPLRASLRPRFPDVLSPVARWRPPLSLA